MFLPLGRIARDRVPRRPNGDQDSEVDKGHGKRSGQECSVEKLCALCVGIPACQDPRMCNRWRLHLHEVFSIANTCTPCSFFPLPACTAQLWSAAVLPPLWRWRTGSSFPPVSARACIRAHCRRPAGFPRESDGSSTPLGTGRAVAHHSLRPCSGQSLAMTRHGQDARVTAGRLPVAWPSWPCTATGRMSVSRRARFPRPVQATCRRGERPASRGQAACRRGDGGGLAARPVAGGTGRSLPPGPANGVRAAGRRCRERREVVAGSNVAKRGFI